ncbi:MAG: hypothetical protein WBP93_10675 [Pyrinomonadaceae bacterium]
MKMNRAARVVPNESKVRGRLLSIKPEADGEGSVWEIAVEAAEDVDNTPNFAKSHVGETIKVYVNAEDEHSIAEQDEIEAHVSYRGDEHGGRFALSGDVQKK